MVIELRKIGIIFSILVVVQTTSWFYFNTQIKTVHTQLNKKKETLSTLATLEKKWSLKHQKSELKRVYEFLTAFDIQYKIKKRTRKTIITMNLTTTNVNKVVSFLSNRDIHLKKLTIKKSDKHSVKLSVEIE